MDKKLRFLVVDDDEIDRMQVRRSLKKAGFNAEVAEACNAEHALSLVRDTHFDFGFLDYKLPDSDGLTLLNTLREQGFIQPIVILTGQGDEQVAVELMKAGAADYISKGTVEPQRLKRTVNSALRVYRAECSAERAEAKLRANNKLLKKTNAMLRQQKQQIEQQNIQLVEAVRLKSEFIATVSHELRTPMNSIIGFSQILERQTHGQLSDRQLEMLNRITNNGHQLQTLIDDLLDFSKIGAEGMQLLPTAFDLNQLVAETAAEFRILADRKQLDLVLDCQLQDTQVTNDPVRVRQILTNLLSNAIKFTDQGEIRLCLSSHTPNAKNPEPEDAGIDPHVVLTVMDSGIGMAPEQQASIFDPFRQLDQSITRKRAGTGLGLAIVHSLVELMGGCIELDSDLDQGSTFRVILPRHIPQSNDPADPDPDKPASIQRQT